MTDDLAGEITAAWNARNEPAGLRPELAERVAEAIDLLDRGEARVAEVVDGKVVVHEWLKQAILLCFRLRGLETIELGPFEYHDRIPLKRGYAEAKVRAVPGASARWGSYLAPGVTLMPSYVNIGAYVGEGSMVDTWATVGSCAQVGKGVHLSGGVGVGGVLEPPQAAPVIIEDDAFVGSRSIVVEGARVCRGAKLGAGVVLTASTPVIDSATGNELSRGVVPERAVAVPATRIKSFPGGDFGLSCVLVLRILEEGEQHDKLALNAILRDHGLAPWSPAASPSPSLVDLVAAAAAAPAGDLLALTAALVAVPSVSLGEEPLTGAVEARLRGLPGLDVERVGLNVVARTNLGRERRVVLAGHLDTVPANGNAVPRIEGDVLHGLGAADMKSGVAVLLRLAEDVAADSRLDCTFVFYEAEEIADECNGLRKLFAERPDLVAGDFAVLLEPTDLWLEAGCQGSIRLEATFRGRRAHTARPWQGINAVDRAAPVLQRLAGYQPQEMEVDGLRFRQALSVVGVRGGVAGNVVPDECTVVVNRRYAPALSLEEAEAEVRALLDGADEVALTSVSPAAHPNLSHPLVAEFAGLLDLPVRCKLGWTDVARFSAHGVPAVNFGPGDPEVSHTAGEHVTRASVEGCYRALAAFLVGRSA